MASSAGVKRGADHLSTSVAADSKKSKSNGSITAFFGAPKPNATLTTAGNGPPLTPTSTVSNFNKEKWVSSLTAEQKELLKLEIDTLHESWLGHLKDELLTKEFLALKRFLQSEIDAGQKVFPPLEDIYSWSRHTPLHEVKAVILGQDPYHNHGQAHGLCFSVRPPTPAPPSLQNMYIALRNDYPSFRPPPNKGGLLTPWAENGVLMINACLTVRAHNANSHANQGWERFTQKVIDTVAKVRTRGVVFLAWGAAAGKRVSHIQKQRHCVLRSVHPSPLSARNGFFTCGHFKKANQWLEERYGATGVIDWDLAPEPIVAASPQGAVDTGALSSKEANGSIVAVDKAPTSEGKSNDRDADEEPSDDYQKN